MNAPVSPSTAAPAVTLSRQEKEKLLREMYSKPLWIELVRVFGYRTLPMEEAREAIRPLATKHGKEPAAAACETLVEIFTQDQQPFARLKAHVRRMAFQILGPEPAPNAQLPIEAPPAQPEKATEGKLRPPVASRRKKPASRTVKKETASPAKVSGSSLMEQYRAAKEKHPNMLLLFRVGDFYELFEQDAETAHKLLGLTLTTRDRTITMAGFPHHQLEAYLHKLLKEGQRVAVCEPAEESLPRGPIRREVTRVVTLGTADEPNNGSDEHEGKSVRQPRHFVLKKFEAWMKEQGLAFVSVDDVKRTTPAVAAYVGTLDFIVLRGEEKLLVIVRPHLRAKHQRALRELVKLFGDTYRGVRIWPNDGRNWTWHESPAESAE